MVADRCRSKPWPYYGLRSVWPDVGIKSSPKFSESCQKLSTAVFNLKLSFVKVAQKDVEYLANLYTSIVTQNFQKSLNLVTLLAMINGSVAAAEEEDECLIQLCCAHLLFRIRKNAFLSVKGEPRTTAATTSSCWSCTSAWPNSWQRELLFRSHCRALQFVPNCIFLTLNLHIDHSM